MDLNIINTFIISTKHQKSYANISEYLDIELFIIRPFDQEGYDNSENIIRALRKSREISKYDPVLIINSDMISHSTSKYISEVVLKTISEVDYDTFYLSKSGDNCNMLKKIKGNKNIYRTYSPNGSESIIFSPKGRDKILDGIDSKLNINNKPINKILNNASYKGYIKSICVFPSIFFNDPSFIDDNENYYSYNECLPKKDIEDHNNVTTSIVVGVILLGVLILWSNKKKEE
jgi:hypothetical protein